MSLTNGDVSDALAKEIVQKSTVVMNVAQNTIIITEDRLRLCLMNHLSKIAARDRWIGPVGILITIVTALSTTTFQDKWLKAAEWKAVFVVATFVVGFWALRALLAAAKAPRLDDLVAELKQAGTTRLSGSELTPPTTSEQKMIEIEVAHELTAAVPAKASASEIPCDDQDGFRPGQKVRHPKYGEGTVIQRQGEGDAAKITVNFPRFGLKKLVEKYAQLEPV